MSRADIAPGYTLNISTQWLTDNVNATTDQAWPLPYKFQLFDTKAIFALYIIGTVLGWLAAGLTIRMVIVKKTSAGGNERRNDAGTWSINNKSEILGIGTKSVRAGCSTYVYHPAISKLTCSRAPSYSVVLTQTHASPSKEFLDFSWIAVGCMVILLFISALDL